MRREHHHCPAESFHTLRKALGPQDQLLPDEPVPAPDADTPREYHTIEVVHYSGDATKTEAQCN